MGARMILFLAGVLLTGTALAQTAVYKWVDKSGQVHYSTVPPSVSLTPTSIVNTATTSSEAPAATSAPAVSTTRAAEQALTVPMPADTPACKSAREILQKYLSATYLYTLGKDGKQEKLSKEQEAAARAEARSTVSAQCSPTGLPQ